MDSIPLAKAESLAARVAELLSDVCERIEIAGSIRRRRPVVGDIDLVALPVPGLEAELSRVFRSCAEVGGLMLDGRVSKRCRLRKSGVQCDLWIAHHPLYDLITPLPTNWGAMMLTYTGSTQHNIRILERAKNLGHTWKPGHGLVREDGRIHSETEEEIFAALQWDYILPQDRHA